MIEIGHIVLGRSLRRTAAATEAIFLLARHAFDELGYRRLEWKCDARNEPSRRAAERFGFRYEGTFRAHMIVKGRAATPRGSRSSRMSGRRCAPPSRRGSTRRTSTSTAHSGGASGI